MTTSEANIALVKMACEKSNDKHLVSVTLILLDAYKIAVEDALRLDKKIHEFIKDGEK